MCPANSQHTVSVSCSNLGLDIPFCLSYILCLYANSTCEHEQTAKSQGGKMGLSDSTPSLLSFSVSLSPPPPTIESGCQAAHRSRCHGDRSCLCFVPQASLNAVFLRGRTRVKEEWREKKPITCIGEMSLCELI